MDPFTQTPPPKEGSSVGPMIGLLIILIILVVGGLYFWGKKIVEQRQLEMQQRTQKLEDLPPTDTPSTSTTTIDFELRSSPTVETPTPAY